MISAEQIPARVTKWFSSLRLRLHAQKSVAETTPATSAADKPDPFQMQQAQKLARIVKSMEQSGIHIIPSIPLDAAKKEMLKGVNAPTKS